MVKIPTYDKTFKKRTLVKDTYSGFSGGEIQVASQRANIDFKVLLNSFWSNNVLRALCACGS